MQTRALASTIAAALLLSAASGGVRAAAPTIEQATAVIKAGESASRQQDVRKVASFMSADCVVVGNWPGPGGDLQETRMDVDSYVQKTLEAEQHISDRSYESTAPTVTVDGDKAIARLRATTKSVINGKHVEATADQIETLELRDGTVKITRAETTAVSLIVDGQRVF
jgi:ketosteroid isomerase-like protein